MEIEEQFPIAELVIADFRTEQKLKILTKQLQLLKQTVERYRNISDG